jgi:hypothetical protein
MSQALEQAKALLAMEPLPEDAEHQLEALADQADEDEQFMFDGLFEALFVRQSGG